MKIKSKKKGLGIYIVSPDTYTSFLKLQTKKNVLEGDCLLKLFKGDDLKKSLGNPAIQTSRKTFYYVSYFKTIKTLLQYKIYSSMINN